MVEQKEKSHKEIKFFGANNANGYLSNFYAAKFTDSDGNVWPTNEHYF